mgnify:FL=1
MGPSFYPAKKYIFLSLTCHLSISIIGIELNRIDQRKRK